MAALSGLILLLVAYQTSAGGSDSVIEGTELVFTFLTHRHGDRTPVEQMAAYLGGSFSDELQDLVAPWGYGQLTNRGRQRGYSIGQFIRRRYDELLSDTFNRSEIYIRSTDSTRTKMTVLSAMAAVYPAVGDTWSEDINWVPVPYTTVPSRYDFNTAMVNCPNFISAYYASMLSPSAEPSPVLAKVSEIIGFDISTMPSLAFAIYDLYVSELSLGINLSEEITALLPELEVAASEGIDIMFGNENNIALQAGVLLNEFFTTASAVIAGEDTRRVRVYSAHDFNVYSMQAVSQVTPRQGVPKYGSIFSLELRRVVETGQYVVLPVYVGSPENPERYLQVDGCDGLLCDFNQFHDITSKYLLEEDEWRSLCGYTEDTVIDSSSID